MSAFLSELLKLTLLPGAVVNFISTKLLRDRKSTRLNSSHVRISYAVVCLKKKKNTATVALVNRFPPVHHPSDTRAAHGHTVDLARLDIPNEPSFAASWCCHGIGLAWPYTL